MLPVMETYPYMSNSYGATEWVWASAGQGRRLLGLPTDADVLSLYILSPRWALIELDVTTDPSRCFVLHSAECRLHEIRKLLIHNVTSRQRHQRRHRDYVCHYVINNTVDGDSSRLMHRCCETDEFRAGDVACTTYVGEGEDMCMVTMVIYIISVVATLYSPIVLMKIKMALKFDSVTKFFRASLKNGITGQRNYVIRSVIDQVKLL